MFCNLELRGVIGFYVDEFDLYYFNYKKIKLIKFIIGKICEMD